MKSHHSKNKLLQPFGTLRNAKGTLENGVKY